MHDRNRFILIIMRMRIMVARRPMCCPARMADTDRPRHRNTAMRLFIQYLQPAGRFLHTYFLSVINCHPGRIIPPVFQLGKSVQKDRRCLFFSDITYDSTHVLLLLLKICSYLSVIYSQL